MIVRLSATDPPEIVGAPKKEKKAEEKQTITVSSHNDDYMYINGCMVPRKIFHCDVCKTYTDAVERDAHHKNHSGNIFKPKLDWYMSRIPASYQNEIRWIEKLSGGAGWMSRD